MWECEYGVIPHVYHVIWAPGLKSCPQKFAILRVPHTRHCKACLNGMDRLDRLQFFSRSANRPAGKGVGEVVGDVRAYSQLNSIPSWRKELSNFSDSCIVPYDGLTFRTVEHAFQFAKLSLADVDAAADLSVESGSDIGVSGSGLDARKRRKSVLLTKAQLATWATHKPTVLRSLWSYKAQNCPLFRSVLQATRQAQLWHLPGHGLKAERWHALEEIRKSL